MNRSDSAEAYIPSMMSFVGLEGSRQQKQHHWDWETSTQNPNPNTIIPTLTPTAHQSYPFFPNNTRFLDCPPPLLPMNSFPFYSPSVAEYPAGLIKREEGGGRIGLNLGHRTYFSSGDGLAIDRLFARSRGVYSLSHHPPRCQAEGCEADLSSAKHYHRRHKVCEFHSKASVVIAGGLQQRFCQQCSRFHVLAEFDEAKRSCRKRLADHNRRRRKPQLQATTITIEDSSPMNPTASTEKSKETPKPTTGISTSKSITTIPPAKTSLEGQQGYQNKATHLRNDPSLSLGGVGTVEEGMRWSQSLYRQHQGPFVVMSDEKSSQKQQHLVSSPSSNTLFHQHNLFCSTSNEASQSTGEVSDYHQSSLLHLGPAMFEVDFM